MASLFWAVWLLGAADLAATTWGLHRGVVREVNPVMVDLFERGPLAAWVVGLALPAAGLYLLWRVVRRHPKAVYVAWGLLAVRLGILAVHLDWITRYLAYRRMH
jgi:hypothetical protein